MFPDFCPGGPIDVPAKQVVCPSDPTISFSASGPSYSFENFNLVSFDSFYAPSGDVEGRALIKNNLNLPTGTYSFGYELRTGGSAAWDQSLPYSLVVGGNMHWAVGGEVYPLNAAGDGYPAAARENIYVGGSVTGGLDYMVTRRTGGPCAGCLNDDFANALAFYTMLSNSFDAVANNAAATLQWGGVQITCTDAASSSYSAHIKASALSGSTWFLPITTCNPNAQFVLNIEMDIASVKFQGDHLAFFQPEKILYNVPGTGKQVNVMTEVRGSLLAPGHSYYQPNSGVYKGNVIVGNVVQAHQINRIFCETPAPPPNPPTYHYCPFFETACTGLNFPLGSGVYSFRDFNVVSFNDFHAETGDVEGRIATKRDASFGNGYSVGFELETATSQPDNSLPYSLIVGRDLTWGSGSLHPDGTGYPLPGNREDMFVGGNAAVHASLVDRRTGGPCGTAGCLDAYFNAAQQCYIGFSNTLGAQADNVAKNIQWSNLEITCSAQLDRYVVSLTPAEMALFTYTTLTGCNFQAEWIINIRGTGPVSFRGDSFPGLPGGVVYNIIGDRAVSITETLVNGHVLAPTSTINQPGGVIVGKVVAGDVTFSLQINKPDCPNPGVIVVTTTTPEPTEPGTEIPVSSITSLRAGDSIRSSDGQVNTIVAAYENPSRIVVATPMKAMAQNTLITATINGNALRPQVDTAPTSSAVAVSVSVALFAILALLF
jgi:choice-of-anchor A domain-containing protein